jgi:hypothetical protein
MDWHIVIKIIKGHRYRYRQKTWRENGRVRTKSEYLGPVVERDSVADAYDVLTGNAECRDRSRLGWAGRDETRPYATERADARREHPIEEFLKSLVRKNPDRDMETEAQMQARVAAEDAERATQERVNDLLSADTISLDAIGEIADIQADAQNEGESEDSPEGSTE